MDEPERRGENHLLNRNSNQHKRYGYLFPWHEFEDDVLRPCQNCKDLLLDESHQPWEAGIPHCPDCTSFAIDHFHPKFVVELEEDFPFALMAAPPFDSCTIFLLMPSPTPMIFWSATKTVHFHFQFSFHIIDTTARGRRSTHQLHIY
jgi:hypothetical protein